MARIRKTIEEIGSKGFSGIDFLLGITVAMLAVGIFVATASVTKKSIATQDNLDMIQRELAMLEYGISISEKEISQLQIMQERVGNRQNNNFQMFQRLLPPLLEKNGKNLGQK